MRVLAEKVIWRTLPLVKRILCNDLRDEKFSGKYFELMNHVEHLTDVLEFSHELGVWSSEKNLMLEPRVTETRMIL